MQWARRLMQGAGNVSKEIKGFLSLSWADDGRLFKVYVPREERVRHLCRPCPDLTLRRRMAEIDARHL